MESETNALRPWKVCARCGVHITGGENVLFSYRPTTPTTLDELGRKVCQWAAQADRRDGKLSPGGGGRPIDCANPSFDPSRSYGPFDEHGIPDIPTPHEDEL